MAELELPRIVFALLVGLLCAGVYWRLVGRRAFRRPNGYDALHRQVQQMEREAQAQKQAQRRRRR